MQREAYVNLHQRIAYADRCGLLGWWMRLQLTFYDPVLPFPILPHRTVWPGCGMSEEYLVPEEHKERLLHELYPYVEVPGMGAVVLDLHAKRRFVVREFKVVREQGMNLLVSPYYYQAGGSVIDWVPVNPEGDQDEEEDWDDGFPFRTTAHEIRPGAQNRLCGLVLRQHEGPAFPSKR